jgi:hypothetical protein
MEGYKCVGIDSANLFLSRRFSGKIMVGGMMSYRGQL